MELLAWQSMHAEHRDDHKFHADQKLYYRCDQKGCDKHAAEMEASGMFLNITPVPGKGMIAKMSLLPKMQLFHETATIMMDALISYGTCQETQRPN